MNLSKLNITNKWKDTKFNFDINSNITYNHQNINPFNGNLAIKDFTMVSPSDLYTIKTISLNACKDSMSLQSDFGNIAINGQYNISTLAKSINNLLHEKLPTMFTEQPNVCNKFQIKANISNSEWVNRFFNVPLELKAPMNLTATIDDEKKTFSMYCKADKIIYKIILMKISSLMPIPLTIHYY